MDAIVHQPVQCRVDHPMPPQRRLPRKGGADDTHMEVPLALTGMAPVFVPFVQYLQLDRRERRLQALANLLGHWFGHAGKALRNGLICTSA